MSKVACIVGSVLAMAGSMAWAKAGLRIGAESAAEWGKQVSWQSNPSEGCSVTARDNALDFCVPEPNRGMKWTYTFEAADIYVYRWLVVRYRVVNYAPGAIDYLVWCNADTGADGLRLLPPNQPPWDEQPQVVAFDLQQRNAGDEISTIAVQCRAGAGGDAHLIVESIELTDRPPAEAEGDVVPVAEEKTVEPDVLKPELWASHKDWLSNPADEFDVTATDAGLRFEVKQAGQGMKWSTELPESIDDMLYLSVRYRAENLEPRTWDYFVYLAARGGGQANEEQYCLQLSDLSADGDWHVATAPVTVRAIKAIAVQAQALSGAAYAEIDWLRFSNLKPEMSLQDILAYEPVEALRAEEKPLQVAGPLTTAADGQAALDVTSWFEAPAVSVRDVRFRLIDDGKQVAATPFKETGEIGVGGGVKASEVYLLLGARFARVEEPSYGGGQLRQVTDPHRFVVEVTYEDGMVDEFIPAVVPAGGTSGTDNPAKTGSSVRYGVKAGIDAYVIGPLAEKPIGGISLRDGMRNGQFLLAAATANTGKARFAAPGPERPYRVAPAPPRRERWERDHKPNVRIAMRRNSLEVSVEATTVMDKAGVLLDPPGLPPLTTSGSLFTIKVGDETVPMNGFELDATDADGGVEGGPVLMRGSASAAAGRISCELLLSGEEEGGIGIRLALKNEGTEPVQVQPTFPDLPTIKAPEQWGETWYFFPRRGCVINDIPIGLREAYSGAFPFQVESVFWPEAGIGLYMMTRDMELTHRYWRLSKDANGVRMGIEYPTVTLGPGEIWRSVDTVIGENPGDWHGAWQAYRDWLNTWYKPAAPRKAWFRKVFNFRQHFLHFELPEKSGLFDSPTKQCSMDPVIDRDAEAFGGVDYLHLFDWGWSPEYGRCGDYDHWEQLGGADNFAQAVAGVQKRNIPVGLYIEGYLVDPPSNYGKAHGAEYQLLNAEGKPYPYFAPSYNMCSAVKEWQDYLADVYKRTREVTGALGYYVDQMGFTDPGHICYATNHRHPVPWPPAPGQRDLMRKIREALGPDAALYTEESPPDVMSQFQDGSFTYNHASVSDEWSPTHLNLYRFTIPSFKTFEIIVCDKPLGSNVQAVKRVFFSGEGLWIEGIADKWFTPETRATIAKTHSCLTQYADAFTSDNPTPLVPTLRANVYANEFPAGDGRRLCVWTLYNANPRTVRGAMLRVPHVKGAKYVDAWRDRPAAVEVVGDEAVISLELGPKDLGCVARVGQ